MVWQQHGRTARYGRHDVCVACSHWIVVRYNLSIEKYMYIYQAREHVHNQELPAPTPKPKYRTARTKQDQKTGKQLPNDAEKQALQRGNCKEPAKCLPSTRQQHTCKFCQWTANAKHQEPEHVHTSIPQPTNQSYPQPSQATARSQQVSSRQISQDSTVLTGARPPHQLCPPNPPFPPPPPLLRAS